MPVFTIAIDQDCYRFCKIKCFVVRQRIVGGATSLNLSTVNQGPETRVALSVADRYSVTLILYSDLSTSNKEQEDEKKRMRKIELQCYEMEQTLCNAQMLEKIKINGNNHWSNVALAKVSRAE